MMNDDEMASRIRSMVNDKYLDYGKQWVSYTLHCLEGWVWIKDDDDDNSIPSKSSSSSSSSSLPSSSSSSSLVVSWHWNSLFVAQATMVNMCIFFAILFFWVINRQTHLRPTKGSTIVHQQPKKYKKNRNHKQQQEQLTSATTASSTSSTSTIGSTSDDSSSDDDDDDDDHDDDYDDDDIDEKLEQQPPPQQHKQQQQQQQQQQQVHDNNTNKSMTTTSTTKQRGRGEQRSLSRTNTQRQQRQRRRSSKDLRRRSQSLKALVTSVTDDDTDDDDDDDEDDDDNNNNDKNNHKDNDDYDADHKDDDDDDDYDDDDDDDDDELVTEDESGPRVHRSSTSTTGSGTRNDQLNLLSVLKKIKVFSYLNEQAQTVILEYLEYIDVASPGQYIFHRHEFDGSLYAVVHGTVQCRFHEYTLPSSATTTTIHNHHDDHDDHHDFNPYHHHHHHHHHPQQQQQQNHHDNQNNHHVNNNVHNHGQNNDNHQSNSDSDSDSDSDTDTDTDIDSNILTFSAGPGDVVTPLLALLEGLVQDQQQPQPQPPPQQQPPQQQQPLMGFSSDVSLIATSPNTRLIRVPPRGFSAMMKLYPAEVNRIIHTVVCRVQRVSIQVLVKTLGLQSELYMHGGPQRRQTPRSAPAVQAEPEAQVEAQVPVGGETLHTTTTTTTTTNNNSQNQSNTTAATMMATDNQPQQQPQPTTTTMTATATSATEKQRRQQILQPLLKKIAAKLHATKPSTTSTTVPSTTTDPEIVNPINTTTTTTATTDSNIIEEAIQVAAIQLGLPPLTTEEGKRGIQKLKQHSNIVSIPKGETIIQMGRRYDDAIYLLLDGTVQLSTGQQSEKLTRKRYHHKHHRQNNRTSIYLPPGSILGTLAAFTGEVSLFTIRCCYNQKNTVTTGNNSNNNNNDKTTHCTFLKIPTLLFHQFIEQYPGTIIRCLEIFLALISPVVHLLNWNSDWMQVKAAELVARQGDSCHSMFLVLNGRLRAHYRQPKTKKRKQSILLSSSSTTSWSQRQPQQQSQQHNRHSKKWEEYGRGKCLGNVEGLSGTPWPYDVYAIRNSELARVPLRTLLAVIAKYPTAGLHFAKFIASRVQQQQQQQYPNHQPQNSQSSNHTAFVNTNNPSTRSLPSSKTTAPIPPGMPSYGLTLATIAVVPLTLVNAKKTLSDFCTTLQYTLHTQIAPTKLVTKKFVQNSLRAEMNQNKKKNTYKNKNKNKNKNNKPKSTRNTSMTTTRNAMFDLKLGRLVGDIEENHRLVVYQADEKYTWWTKFCIQQADLILVAVHADQAPYEQKQNDNNDDDDNNKNKNKTNKTNKQTYNATKTTTNNTTTTSATTRSRIEQCLAWAYDSMNVRIEMVVVSNSTTKKTSDTNSPRKTMTMTMTSSSSSSSSNNSTTAATKTTTTNTTTTTTTKEDGQEEDDDEDDNDHYYGIYDNEINVSDQLNNWFEQREWIVWQHIVREPFHRHSLDFRRLCRRVTGQSVGLVLGGGGARGLAHLGIIKALQEAGIIVDMVGGTSQGAFVGALYAKTPDDFDELMKSSRQMANAIASTKELLMDLTLPMTSMFSGRRFNYNIRKLLKKLRVQDLVLNFFCMSTDLQKREQVVHTKGLLWKYVRASMSLTGYLPPVAENGSLLVDGGYTNVVPADVMKYQMGARTVIAVDVSGECYREYMNYGTHLSGWWILFNSLNPFVRTVQVPSMGDLSDSLRWVSSDQHRKTIIQATDLHLVPPVDRYGTLDYAYFDEIVNIGYNYAKPIIDDFVYHHPHLVVASRTSTATMKATKKASSSSSSSLSPSSLIGTTTTTH